MTTRNRCLDRQEARRDRSSVSQIETVAPSVAGVKGENSIKVFGPDLDENESSADKIVDTLQKARSVTDLGKFGSLGQPNVRITPDRSACARYVLNSGDVLSDVVATAIGGQAVTLLFIVPLTLLIIALLVYALVRTWLDTVIVLVDVPIACTGGLLALLLTRTNFSVSAKNLVALGKPEGDLRRIRGKAFFRHRRSRIRISPRG